MTSFADVPGRRCPGADRAPPGRAAALPSGRGRFVCRGVLCVLHEEAVADSTPGGGARRDATEAAIARSP